MPVAATTIARMTDRFITPLLLWTTSADRPSGDATRRATRLSSGPDEPSPRSGPCVRRHVAQERRRIDAAAGRRLDERLRVEAPAGAGHVRAPTPPRLPRPLPNPPTAAPPQRPAVGARVGLEPLPELRGDEATECVAREVVERA